MHLKRNGRQLDGVPGGEQAGTPGTTFERATAHAAGGAGTPPLPPDSRRIRIAIDRGHIAVADLVGRAWERCWRRWAQQVGLPGVRPDRRGRLWFPAGLVPEAVRELEGDGYRVEVQDLRRDVLDADRTVIGGAEGADRRYLEAVAAHPLGVVEVADDAEMVSRIAQLVRLYPGARVIVAVATRRAAWALWRALGGHLGEAVGLVTAKTRRPGRRCAVCTYRMLARHADRSRAVLVIVEAERALRSVAAYAAGEGAYPRVYGVVYAGVTLDEVTDLRLRALAGEVIHAAPAPAAPARVMMIPSPSTPTRASGRGLHRKRRAVWENRPRNRLVARVARALLEGDVDTLHESGVDVHCDELNARDRRVAVLVESTAHARELRSLLRGWQVLSVAPAELREPLARDAADVATGQGVIVTLLHAALRGLDADLVVRATGGRGEWLADGFPPRQRDTGRPAPLVIDLLDAVDKWARTDTRLRIADYRRRRWPVEGAVDMA